MISKVDALSSNLIFWHVEECSDKIVVNLLKFLQIENVYSKT